MKPTFKLAIYCCKENIIYTNPIFKRKLAKNIHKSHFSMKNIQKMPQLHKRVINMVIIEKFLQSIAVTDKV